MRERLSLFVSVCQAVQHAHQKGIIHRDLKPSNILVCLYDGQPVSKVIDFGLAKAMHQPLTENTLYTAHGLMVGTPLYMSPEQAEFNNLDIDTRTDIYSLGVILYELLTGTTPLEKQQFKSAALQEILRLIKEQEPTKPSTKITGNAQLPIVAAQRGLEPTQLSRTLRGDIDWIVMKALEKERSRRYETANGLARDIDRFLLDLPVEAGPPSTFYRFWKFARRNRVAITTSVVVLITLLLGIVVSAAQAIRATRAEQIVQRHLAAETLARNDAETARQAEVGQRNIAEEQRVKAELAEKQAVANARLARQTVNEYFTQVSESRLLDIPGLQPLREQLLESALRYYQSFLNQPGGDARDRAEFAATRLRISQVYEQNNRIDDSIKELDVSLDLVDELSREQPLPVGFPQCLAGFRKSGRILNYFTLDPSNPQEAIRVAKRAIAQWSQFVRQYPDQIGFQADLASFYCDLSDVEYSLNNHAASLGSAQAAKELLEGLIVDHPRSPEYHSLLADALEFISREHKELRQFENAESALRASIAIRSRLVTEVPDIPSFRARLAYSFVRLGNLLDVSGRTEEAIPFLEQAIDRWHKLVADFPADPGFRKRLTHSLCRLATIHRQRGKFTDAEKLLREAVDIRVKLAEQNPGERGDNLAEASDAYAELVSLLTHTGRHSEGQEQLRLALKFTSQLKNRSPASDSIGHSYRMLAFAARELSLNSEAEKALRDAIEMFQKASLLTPNQVIQRHFLADTHRHLASVLASQQRLTEAEAEFRLSLDIHEECVAELQSQPFNVDEWAESYWDFASFLGFHDRPREAKAIHDRLLTSIRDLAKKNPGNSLYRMQPGGANQLARSLVVNKNHDAQWFHFASDLSKNAVNEAPHSGQFWNTLGVAEYRLGNWRAAESALLKAIVQRGPGFSDTWFFLAMACQQLGKPEQARKCYEFACLWTERYAPDDAELVRFRAEANIVLGIPKPIRLEKFDDLTLMQALIAADPNTKAVWCWEVLLESHIREQRWVEAKPFAVRWAELQPDNMWVQYQLAALLARLGDSNAYRRSCETLLTQFAESRELEWVERTAKVCTLLKGSDDFLSSASRLADRAVNLDSQHWVMPFSYVAAGLVSFRRGDFRSCVDWCDRALTKEFDDGWFRSGQAFAIRAMAHARLGQDAEALVDLERAKSILLRMHHEAKNNGVRGWWNDLAICELLGDEATQALRSSSK